MDLSDYLIFKFSHQNRLSFKELCAGILVNI